MDLISEADLRAQLRVLLAPKAASGARLVEEFGIERGNARIDVALIGDELEAFEIKSDLDSFARMSNQIHAFNRVFDRLWVVTGPVNAEAAQRIVPSWWGILAGQRKPDRAVSFVEIRPAQPNPRKDALSLALLLWREEAAQLVTRMNLGPISKRATRLEMGELLASAIDVCSLQRLVAQAIGARLTAALT